MEISRANRNQSKCGTNSRALVPGSTIGIFGGGQLGRMMTIAAKQMGYRVHVFSPDHHSPAAQVADQHTQSLTSDLNAIANFARGVDVLTVETENLPVEALIEAAQHTRVHPGHGVLEVAQNRLKEKWFMVENKIPVCRFQHVRSLADLDNACDQMLPFVLKSTTGGYDGKNQAIVRSGEQAHEVWRKFQLNDAIVEEFVEFDFEFSVVAARSSTGEFVAYSSIRNLHRNHILDISISPSGLSKQLNDQAVSIAREIMERLEVVGVLTVEFFKNGDQILVNEIAPRPHNSGHMTIDAHETSQFEQHIRAICGLPLGSTRQLGPAVSGNLLGQHLAKDPEGWERLLLNPAIKLHLYGKNSFKVNRKVGHLTTVGSNLKHAVRSLLNARSELGRFNEVPPSIEFESTSLS